MKNVNATEISNSYAEALEEKLNLTDRHPQLGLYTIEIAEGRVYDKLIQSRGTHGSVHAFIERKTGALIKPATFKAPQKNADGSLAVRYDLSTEEGFAHAVEKADFAGGYLYAGRN